MNKVILLNKNDASIGEEEAKYEFLKFNLLSMGLPVAEYLPETYDNFTVNFRIKLRETLFKYQVFIKEIGKEMQIWVDNKLIAEWKRPKFVLKCDGEEINPSKRLYLEMHLDYYSSLEMES
jgi:hypothetical protein